MTEYEAYAHYMKKLAEHGWHSMGMLHIKDLKDHINGGTDIVDMPSDDILGCALQRACESIDLDAKHHIEYARDLAMEWSTEENENA